MNPLLKKVYFALVGRNTEVYYKIFKQNRLYWKRSTIDMIFGTTRFYCIGLTVPYKPTLFEKIKIKINGYIFDWSHKK